jgi:serine/threonine protein kinase
MSLAGNTIGDYQIVEELGRGAMAVVYRAYQPSLNRYVALKVLSPELSLDQEFVQRFQREARAAASLQHPNIVFIHDVGQQEGPGRAGGIYYLVMEYLEGETLKDLMRREAPLPPQRVAHIVEQVSAALDYAHQRGSIHGDIKPTNIFVGKGDHVTVTDFGIARAARETQQLERAGVLVPPLEYMSPEQARGEAVDHRSDLYALGVVLYQTLVGRMPFGGTTPQAVLQDVIHQSPPPPRQYNPNLSPALEAVILKALAKDPRQRFQRAAEMVKALRQALGQGAAAVPATGWPATMTDRSAAAAQGWPANGQQDRAGAGGDRSALPWILAGIIGVLLVAVIVLLAILLIGSPGEETPIALLSPSPSTAPTQTTAEDTPVPTEPTSTIQPSATTEAATEVSPPASDTPTATATATASPSATPTHTSTPTSTPTPTSTSTWTPTVPPPCAVPVDAELAAAWDRERLGCPTGPANITWAAWEPFERGHMLWREDTNLVYVLHFRNGTDTSAGDWRLIVDEWDGSNPDGIGLSPPPGLYEPKRGFGWVWRTYLGGPSSQVGWAREEEKGFCAKFQPFEQGLILHSSTVEFCHEENLYNWATNPSFSPLFFALYEDGRWRRY